jgi:hypothetical protein
MRSSLNVEQHVLIIALMSLEVLLLSVIRCAYKDVSVQKATFVKALVQIVYAQKEKNAAIVSNLILKKFHEILVPFKILVVCHKKIEAGPCKGAFTRWGYDSKTQSCVMFSYGGCDGNENRFITEEECKTSCGKYIK